MNASGRRWAAVVVLLLSVATGCIAGGTPENPTSSTASTSTPSPAPSEDSELPPDEASDGAEVAVVETGFSNVTDDSGRLVSYAIVLANRSKDVAFGTVLQIELLDADGEPIKDLVADREQVALAANLVLPGKRQAISNRTYVDRPVQRLEITVDEPHWRPADGRFTALTVSEVRPVPDDGKLEIGFRVQSRYRDEVSPAEAYAIFRDRDGKLLGGTSYGDADQHSYPPGSTDTEIEVSAGLPPKWESVEVYADPFLGDRI
jgi:hypothetical protein